MRLHYVTSNKTKYDEANLILHRAPNMLENIDLVHTHIDLDELQGEAEIIVSQKVERAFHLLQAPVIVDDISFGLDAILGLPGPYIRSFLETLKVEGLWDLASRYENRQCQATCYIALKLSERDPCRLFHGSIRGTIVAPQGTLHHGPSSWNSIIQPEGHSKTVAQMTLEECSQISPRNRALSSLKQFLSEHNGEPS